MKVIIATAAVWDGKRREAGSVIDVPAEVWEKNQDLMKPTDAEVADAPAEKPSKTSQTSKTAETDNADQ